MDLARPNENEELLQTLQSQEPVGWAPEVCLETGLEQVIQSIKVSWMLHKSHPQHSVIMNCLMAPVI